MKKLTFQTLTTLLILLVYTSVYAQYTETMEPEGLTKNLKDDYGLVDNNAASNQSELLRNAINDVNTHGGGRIIIPKGTYNFSHINLKSNVHIMIEAGTVIKPALGNGLVFMLSAEKDVPRGTYIENVSIRGVGGPFVVDYHDRKRKDKQRAVIARMVKNFLIENMDVKDNYSTYCGITLTPSTDKGDVSDWEVTRATDGTIKNIRHFKASPGYGLVQCHGAQSCHFENLYSLGGVALRLEVGANNKNVGVYDITGKNIICENGRMALMMGPHSAKSGVVTVDGLKTISCTGTFSCGDGHVKKNAPDQTPGWFSSESSVKNIHAIFGADAQFKGNQLLKIPDSSFYETMKIWSEGKFFTGPSMFVVAANAKSYEVSIENVTMEGFPYKQIVPIIKEGEGTRAGDKWAEKKKWIETHQGAKWQSDKGVVNRDYKITDLLNKYNRFN